MSATNVLADQVKDDLCRLWVSKRSTVVRHPDNSAEAMAVCKRTHAHNVVETLYVLCVVSL